MLQYKNIAKDASCKIVKYSSIPNQFSALPIQVKYFHILKMTQLSFTKTLCHFKICTRCCHYKRSKNDIL